MTNSSQQHEDSSKQKTMPEDLVENAPTLAKEVLNYCDINAPSLEHAKKLNNKFSVAHIQELAEYLKFDLTPRPGSTSKKGYRSLKVLAHRCLLKLKSYTFPSTCGACKEQYTVDHSTVPSFTCWICLQGSHECEAIRKTKSTLQSLPLDGLQGFHWLCTSCCENTDTSLQSMNPFTATNEKDPVLDPIPEGVPVVQEKPKDDPKAGLANNTKKPCPYLANGRCRHGMSGKNEVDGPKEQFSSETCFPTKPATRSIGFSVDLFEGGPGCKGGISSTSGPYGRYHGPAHRIPRSTNNALFPGDPTESVPAPQGYYDDSKPQEATSRESTTLSNVFLLNGRSISPSAVGSTRWKIPFIESTILQTSSLPPIALGITESWLKPYISDAQIALEGYSVFRSDRPERVGGGCVMYIHDSLPISFARSFSDRECSIVIAFSEAKNLLFSCIYRPPDCSQKSFLSVLDILQQQINILSSNKLPDMFIMGDFNLPLFNWGSDSSPLNSSSAGYAALTDFIGENFLTQVVDQPTRGNNILDLIFTNTPQDVASIRTEDTGISDHKLVECLLTINPTSLLSPTTQIWDYHSFRGINIHKGNFDEMSVDLMKVDWKELQQLCKESGDPEGEQFKELFVLTVLQIALKHCPRKRPKSRSQKGPLEKLRRRRRKLKPRIEALTKIGNNSRKLSELLEEENTILENIKKLSLDVLEKQEEKAAANIKINPRYFFSYAKKLSKTKSSIAPLKRDNGTLTNDNAEKAELLQSQYCRVFTEPDSGDPEKSDEWVKEETNTILEDITFTTEDIKKALAELDPYSAGPDGDIPAKILSC
eukprot:sb/3462126/